MKPYTTRGLFTLAESREVADLISSGMSRAGIKSKYQLAMIADIGRSSLRRWLRYEVRIAIHLAQRVIEALAEEIGDSALTQDFNELLPIDSLEARVRKELRLRNIRVDVALDAMRAAGIELSEPSDS